MRRWFGPAEKRYLKLAWDNLGRLRAYLSAMPHGPHAEDVTDRITELESVRVYAARREQRVLERAQAFERRLSEAAAERRAFLHEFSLLARSLGGVHTFGQPKAKLDAELLLRLQQGTGDCDGDHCSKVLRFLYAVPEDKQLSERSVDLTLELSLVRGRLQQVSLSAPALFSRVAEAARVAAVPADNPQVRTEALGQALDIVTDAVTEPLPLKTCRAEAVSPVVLARRCHGVRLEVIAGTEAGAPDRLLVHPETPGRR